MSSDSEVSYEEEGDELSVMNLIRAVKSRPVIWKLKHPLHNNVRETAKIWQEIQKKFPKFSVTTLKKKWKNVKDQFRKEIKKYPPRDGQEAGVVQKSSWLYYDVMLFIESEMGPRKPYNIFDDDPLNDTNKSITAEVDQNGAFPTVDEETEDVPLHKPISASTKKRKINDSSLKDVFIELENRKIKLLERNLESKTSQSFKNSDDYHFFMSLMPQMVSMTTVKKLRIRSKMMQAIIDESDDANV